MSPTKEVPRTTDAFAALVRQARTRRGWSQQQLADHAGVSRTTVIRFESGTTERPDPCTFQAFRAALGFDQYDGLRALGYLITEEAPVAA